ncbi:MAG: SUMF1/EgtB/PvdO family nonheme iron enzyme [Candidatus Omnitrophota bacterium]
MVTPAEGGRLNWAFRVLRGGSWNNNANNCRPANRNRNDPTNRNNNNGFRCASSPSLFISRSAFGIPPELVSLRTY